MNSSYYDFLHTPVPSEAMKKQPTIEEVDSHPDSTFIWSVIHAVRQDAYKVAGRRLNLPAMEIPTSA